MLNNKTNDKSNLHEDHSSLFCITCFAIMFTVIRIEYFYLNLIVIIILDIIFYIERKKVEKIKLKEAELLSEEDKELVKNYPITRLIVVSLSSFQLVFAFIFYFILDKLETIYKVPFDRIINIGVFFTLSIFLAIIITNFRLSYRVEYDFSMKNILSNKSYFRLKFWNYVMYKPDGMKTNSKTDGIVFIRNIITKNRELINYEEHNLFKEKLKSISTECLEEIIFYDKLPIFKKDFKKDITDPEGFSPYLYAGLTLILPVLIESNYTVIVSLYNNLSKPFLLFCLAGLFTIVIIIWNIYKFLIFTDKRNQIDTFFYDDIKAELKARQKVNFAINKKLENQ